VNVGAVPGARLRRWWLQRRSSTPSTAFVLGGGGNRGAVQIGMLQELTARGIQADRCYGASVGAINAAAYAGQPTPEGLAHLESVWLGLRGDDVFPRSRVHGPWRYFQHRPAVHPARGLRAIVAAGLSFHRLEEAVVPLAVVATSLADGAERWFTEGPALPAIMASAAVPALLPPVEIDGEPFIDGGVVDNVPISRAIADGATQVYVLLSGPLGAPPPPPRRPVEGVLSALRIAVEARLSRDLELVPPGVEITLLGPDAVRPSGYRDFSATAELIAAGRSGAAAGLDVAATSAPEAAGWRHTGRTGREPVVGLEPTT